MREKVCFRLYLWIIIVFLQKNTDNMVVNKKNPFAWKAKQTGKKKSSGKRVGKS